MNIKKISALQFFSCISSKITVSKTSPQFIEVYRSRKVIAFFSFNRWFDDSVALFGQLGPMVAATHNFVSILFHLNCNYSFIC